MSYSLTTPRYNISVFSIHTDIEPDPNQSWSEFCLPTREKETGGKYEFD